MVRAETGVGFGSVGECIQHVALGGTLSYLDIDTSGRYDCPAGGTCWGIVIGSGLQAESEVQTSWMTPTGQAFADFIADNRGEISEELNFACGAPGAVSQVRALGATSGGLSIQVVPPVDAPC